MEARIKINEGHTNAEGNLHIALFPFKMPHLVMMMGVADIDHACHYDDGCMNEERQKLARFLFEEIPGLNTLFFDNGAVTLQHSTVFTNQEVFEIFHELMMPRLQEEVNLRELLK